jgi:phospholipase D1/2
VQYIEKDIHHAYVYLIRRATRFIYIENQYFRMHMTCSSRCLLDTVQHAWPLCNVAVGSCQHWKAYQQCGCTNRIPIEIVAKIVSKIHARERFAVYVLMPLYPEGPPADGANQEILHWQVKFGRNVAA